MPGKRKAHLTDSEQKVMTVLWENGATQAIEIRKLLEKENGWREGTTRHIISSCIEKGYIRREDPGYWCYPAITKEEIGKREVKETIKRFFNGSQKSFFASFVDKERKLTKEEYDSLRDLIDKWGEEEDDQEEQDTSGPQ